MTERRSQDRRDPESYPGKTLNIGAILIGCLAVVWAPTPFATPGLVTSQWLDTAGMSAMWTAYLLLFGSSTLYGALRPHRAVRFWSLVALACFFSAFSLMSLKNWTYNPTMAAFAVLAVFCVLILIRDTRRKPRKCHQ